MTKRYLVKGKVQRGNNWKNEQLVVEADSKDTAFNCFKYKFRKCDHSHIVSMWVEVFHEVDKR